MAISPAQSTHPVPTAGVATWTTGSQTLLESSSNGGNFSPRRAALEALLLAEPDAKVAATQALWHSFNEASQNTSGKNVINPAFWHETLPAALQNLDLSQLPGRYARVQLVPPSQTPKRSLHTAAGRAALLHAIAHIEYNAINLALDAVWRWPGMPPEYYADWLRVAFEESTHFALLQAHLATLGFAYGDFAAHDGLWQMCEKTQDDITARMALVPRTLEARGLDATPLIQTKLRRVGDAAAVAILDLILRDEVGHVAIGNHWYALLCARQGLDPVAHYAQLTERYQAPKLKAPLNLEARRKAGFSAIEMNAFVRLNAH